MVKNTKYWLEEEEDKNDDAYDRVVVYSTIGELIKILVDNLKQKQMLYTMLNGPNCIVFTIQIPRPNAAM